MRRREVGGWMMECLAVDVAVCSCKQKQNEHLRNHFKVMLKKKACMHRDLSSSLRGPGQRSTLPRVTVSSAAGAADNAAILLLFYHVWIFGKNEDAVSRSAR